MALFKETYLPAIKSVAIDNFTLFTLTKQAEQDDNCAHIYHKSLLYLVLNSFEEKQRIPFFRDGVPLLGMQKFIEKDNELMALFKQEKAKWIVSPNSKEKGSVNGATAMTHSAFDDDQATVSATLTRMLAESSVQANIEFQSSASHLADRRHQLSNHMMR